MPESTTPPADGTTGTPAATGDGTQSQTPAPTAGDTNPQTGKTFTQEELNQIVADRVARAKPADYDEAKAAMAELNSIKEGQKTDLQKAQEAAESRKQERDSARSELNAARRTAEIRIEALKQGADEELTMALLANDATIKVEDGRVVGAAEAVAALIERKPNLKTGGTRQSAGEFGGNDGATVAEKIAALEREGTKDSLREARRLKIRQGLSLPTPT
jgi:hypothetical protein